MQLFFSLSKTIDIFRSWEIRICDLPRLYDQMKLALETLLCRFQVFHLDIKLENLLYNARSRLVKICDFGIAMDCDDPDKPVKGSRVSRCGTEDVFSPERYRMRYAIPR